MTTSVTNTSSTAATNSSTKATAKKDLDKDAFLKLLVAQLQNQDPTQSQDPNQMVQQMTSYSQLEQMQNMNTSLSGISNLNASLFQAQTANLIGKQVRVTSSSLDVKNGAATVGITLASAANVSLTVKDASGKTVAILDQGAQTAGDHVISWNGKDTQGKTVADGTYSVAITAKDTAGNAVTASTSAFAKVDSVTFTNGTVMVNAGGKSFAISDVTQIAG